MTFLQKLGRHIRVDLYVVMYWVGHLVPKTSRLWVFGSGHGDAFVDNSKHLFLHIQKHHHDVRCVWLTRSPDVLVTLRGLGYEAYDMESWRGCWVALRASVAVVSYGYSLDLNAFAITRQTKLIQLWHGTPLKKLGADDKFDATRKFPKPESQQWGVCHGLGLSCRRYVYRLFPRRQCDLLISPSQEVGHILSRVFALPAERCKVTGYPRNDALFYAPASASSAGYRRVIYMPTWRGQAYDEASFLECDVNKIDRLLEKHHLKLHIKPHPVSRLRPEFVSRVADSHNLSLLGAEDPYEILCSFDALITDYSSIYFDYLLLDRPIVFFAMDLEAYTTRDHELYYDYNSVTPGPVVASWEDMVTALAGELAHPDRYSGQRRAIRDRFNDYIDASSSERVFAEINTLLTKRSRRLTWWRHSRTRFS